MKRVACLLSGGVDSAVAAYLVKQQKIPLTCVHLVNRLLDPAYQEIRRENAEYVSKRLEVPLSVVDLPTDTWDGLKDAIALEAADGNKPHTDILFHRHMLFGALHQHVTTEMGMAAVCTGHWARTVPGEPYEDMTGERGTTVKVFKAVDLHEDESFRLSQGLQKRFQTTLLPLGDMNRQVTSAILRNSNFASLGAMASKLHLEQSDQRKSPIWIKLMKYIKPGSFVDFETGEKLSTHRGLPLYNIGDKVQVGDRVMYVAAKEKSSEIIKLVSGVEHASLYCDHVFTSLAHWTRYTPYNFYKKHTMTCDYMQTYKKTLNCTLSVGMGYEYSGNDHVILSPGTPVWGAEPGKYVAFYIGEECIGGARTLRAGPSRYALKQRQHHAKSTKIEKRGFKRFLSNLKLFSTA